MFAEIKSNEAEKLDEPQKVVVACELVRWVMVLMSQAKWRKGSTTGLGCYYKQLFDALVIISTEMVLFC